MSKNKDQATVDGFGDEWERFDQSELETEEYQELFDRYFSKGPAIIWESDKNNNKGQLQTLR